MGPTAWTQLGPQLCLGLLRAMELGGDAYAHSMSSSQSFHEFFFLGPLLVRKYAGFLPAASGSNTEKPASKKQKQMQPTFDDARNYALLCGYVLSADLAPNRVMRVQLLMNDGYLISIVPQWSDKNVSEGLISAENKINRMKWFEGKVGCVVVLAKLQYLRQAPDSAKRFHSVLVEAVVTENTEMYQVDDAVEKFGADIAVRPINEISINLDSLRLVPTFDLAAIVPEGRDRPFSVSMVVGFEKGLLFAMEHFFFSAVAFDAGGASCKVKFMRYHDSASSVLSSFSNNTEGVYALLMDFQHQDILSDKYLIGGRTSMIIPVSEQFVCKVQRGGELIERMHAFCSTATQVMNIAGTFVVDWKVAAPGALCVTVCSHCGSSEIEGGVCVQCMRQLTATEFVKEFDISGTIVGSSALEEHVALRSPLIFSFMFSGPWDAELQDFKRRSLMAWEQVADGSVDLERLPQAVGLFTVSVNDEAKAIVRYQKEQQGSSHGGSNKEQTPPPAENEGENQMDE